MSTNENSVDIEELNKNPDPGEWKKLVIKALNEVLINMDVRDANRHDDIHIALDFILNASQRLPEIFVKPERLNGFVSNNERCFTNWVILHLMKFLSVLPKLHICCKGTNKDLLYEKHFEMESKILDIFCSFMRIIRVNSHSHFLQILEDFTTSLFDVYDALELFTEDRTRTAIQFKHFQNNEECPEFESPIIFLFDSDSCLEIITINLRVVQDVLMYNCFFSQILPTFWPLVLKMVQIGDCALKRTSLKFLRNLMEFSEPSLEQILQLIDMIFEIIKGISNKADDKHAVELVQEICESLESLLTCNNICYLHQVPVMSFIFSNLLDVFLDAEIKRFDVKTVNVLVASLTKCCKFLCLKSDDEYENNISRLISIGQQLCVLILSHNNEQFKECCHNFFLQIIKSEVDHYFYEKINSPDSSERTILEMRELQCSAKDVSRMSQHLLIILKGLFKKLESSLIAHNNMHCEIILPMIRWFYEILSLGSGLLGKHITNEDRSTYRPPLCDESSRLLQLLLDLLIENSKNKEFIRHCFEEITEILICIVYMSDLFDLDFELCSMVIGFASLPWLSSEMSCLDLKLKDLKSYFRLSDQISDYFDEKALKNCIYLLCTTSKLHLAHQWRFHAIRRAWSETKVYLKCSTLENMVIARHRISSFGLQFKIDILEEAFKISNESLEISIVSSLKNLLCSVSGPVHIFRPIFQHEGIQNLKTHIFFTCEGCHMLQKMNHVAETSPIFTPSVSNNQAFTVLKILRKLFHSKHDSVRLELIKCFKSFYLHLHIFAESNKSLFQEFIEEGLSLMKDSNENIRMELSEIICDLLPKQKMNRWLVEEWVLRWINENIDVTGNSSSFIETYLLTLSHLAWVCDDELLLSCISIILNMYFFPNDERLEVMAEKHLKLICSHKDTNMSLLFKRFSKQICQSLSLCLYETKMKKPKWNILEFLRKVSYVFSFESAHTFLKENEALIIPFLVMKADDTASTLLQYLSEIMGDSDHTDCVIRVISQIFCHIVLTAKSKDDHKRAYMFLEKEVNLSLYELLNKSYHVDSLLLIHLSSCREQVINGLNIWMDVKHYFNEQPNDSPQKYLAELLQPNLLGILVYFDKYLNDYGTSMKEKLEAYASLKLLIELMGEKHVTRVRMRLMKTIKIGLQFKDEKFCKLCCEVWLTFVKTVNLSVFGPMLIQVVVFLLPLYNKFPDEIGQIFTYLIVENKVKLQQHFGDLYIVQPELKDVKSVLMNHQGHGQHGCKTLPQKFERLLKGISHDTLEVKQMALSKLKELLHNSKSDLHDLMHGDEIVSPIISQMVTVLLQGCRESDTTVKNITAQCLGEIGAVDPERLELLTAQRNIKLDYLGTLDGESFCLELINEMTKAFLRVDDSFQDCVAYAIQELMKTCELQMGNEKWNQFSEDTTEIMTPLINSRYKMNIVFNWGDLTKPIYGSERGKTFEKWICSFAGYLGSLISSEKCVTVFQACYGVLRHDPLVAVLLLPAISVQILLENNSECSDMLLQEILAVLNSSKYIGRSTNGEDQNNLISTSDVRHRCTQTVFSLLDRIGRFLKHQTFLSTLSSADAKKNTKEAFDKNIHLMQTFLKKVPQEVLSSSSFNCGVYARSLKHYELYIKSLDSNFHNKEFVDFLLKLYLALDEPDGVSGVMSWQQVQPSLMQQIHSFESIGLLSDASTCYDHAMRLDPANSALKRGLLKVRLAHGELNSVLNLANGMINNDPSSNYLLNTFRVEAAWKLGEWDKLELYLDSENQSVDLDVGLGNVLTSIRSKENQSLDWNIGLGKLLTSIKSKDFGEFNENIAPLRLSVMIPLSAASMELGSYHMAYDSIIRLHMLSEVEEGAHCLFNYQSDDMKDPQAVADWLKNTMNLWKDRIDFCQNSYKSISPILDLHRALLQLIGLETGINVDAHVSSCWLVSARIARECGLKQTAHSSLLRAGNDFMPEFCMERATCFWDKGNFDQSKSCLERTYQALSNDDKFMSDAENKINLSKLLLQLTRYYDELSSVESQKILQMFKDVREMNPTWEDSYFYAGKYYDKMMAFSGDKKWPYCSSIIGHFLQSLLCGSQYIYQSLPRLITLWLDFDDAATMQDAKQAKAKVAELDKINKAIASTSKKLPVYQFVVVLPQLISRICHPNKEVFKILKEIIVMVMGNYPQQVMWHLIAVSKSTYNMRSKRCHEIFTEAKNSYPHLTKFLNDSTKMADLLITLCNKSVKESITTINISQALKPLLQLLNDKDFSQILVPLEKQMIPTLPNVQANPSNHIAFSSSLIFITGIEDKVEVLVSLQKPKKVTFKGSDGKSYVMLCKPKDDLRKDARLMEFTNFVNGCLKKNRESRKRNLHIRTFTVTPLSEDCGMLEWVSNTNGLRPILMKLYKEKGIHMTGSDLRNCQTPPKDSIEKKLEVFKNILLAKHPPIFSEWFLRVFPDPTSWYCARRAFGRTIAVMSMVGYILGLGDRHGENILLDATCGDCVHVDFSCLFNKGETFEYPEVVPFRLTQNMVDAMGVLGYEGIFRKSCEATLKVMREEMDSLMSILRPFIFDPLLEWKKSTRNNNKEMEETLKDDAVQHVKEIEVRLRGHLGSKYVGVPLSVEGQVSTLINEATSEKNLCRMYIGWASYL